MRRLALISLAAVSALAVASAGRTATGLCVGGPHCYSSVQAALDAAQNGDTIRIGPGTFAGGLTITKSVDLVGVAAAATIIRGGGPVVTIGSPTAAPTVTLESLTITGGLTTSNPQAPKCGPDVPTCGPGYANATALGGGIEAFQGTTVTISRSVVTGNRASPVLTTASVKAVCPGPAPCPASFGDAAGIDNWGTMTIVDSTVSDNHAYAVQSDGGGIVAEQGSSLTLLDSRVVGNSANAVGAFGRFVQAGGILADHDATLTVEGSNVDGNSANLTSSIPHPYPLQDGGTDQSNSFSGGIHLNDDVVATIRNSTLNGNSVTVSNPFGEPFGGDAAMCACGSAVLTLENAQVRDNSTVFDVLSTADSGPDGSALEIDNLATIENVQFTGNTTRIDALDGDAGALGALLFLRDDATDPPTVSNSSVSDNVASASAPHGAATVQGAGIVNNSGLVLTNVDVERNRGVAAGLTGSALGGGIWNGQLFGGPESPLTLVDSQVKNNVLAGSAGVTLAGGGIFSPGFPVTLTGSSVRHNAPDDCVGC